MVTSEKNLSCNEIYKIYHNLWRIEESFRMMKSELNARPVFLQKQNTIYGHFFVCYLCTLLTRILQIYELHDEESYQEIFKFFRDFQVVNTNNKFVNLLTKSDFLEKICKITKLPINSRLLTIKQYEKISNFTFK
jgi:transposase